MLCWHADHTAYGQQLQHDTAAWETAWGAPAAWQRAITWCAAADFDRLRPILATAYHPPPGPPAD